MEDPELKSVSEAEEAMDGGDCRGGVAPGRGRKSVLDELDEAGCWLCAEVGTEGVSVGVPADSLGDVVGSDELGLVVATGELPDGSSVWLMTAAAPCLPAN